MTSQIACIGLIWGLCRHVVEIEYKTPPECEKALAVFLGRPNVQYAYCKGKR